MKLMMRTLMTSMMTYLSTPSPPSPEYSTRNSLSTFSRLNSDSPSNWWLHWYSLILTMETKYDNNDVTRWQGDNSEIKIWHNDSSEIRWWQDDLKGLVFKAGDVQKSWSKVDHQSRGLEWPIVIMILIWERITCLWGNIDRNAWTPHQHWDANVKLIWLPWLFQLKVVYGCLSSIIMMQDVYSVWHIVIFFLMVILA